MENTEEENNGNAVFKWNSFSWNEIALAISFKDGVTVIPLLSVFLHGRKP